MLGRADDMIIVRGVNIYPSAIDDLIRSLPDIIEYEVDIRRVEGMDDLLIKLETPGAIPFEETSRSVLNAFRHHFNIRVSVEQAANGSLPRYEFKARTIQKTLVNEIIHRRDAERRRDYAEENYLTLRLPLRPLRLCGESSTGFRGNLYTTRAGRVSFECQRAHLSCHPSLDYRLRGVLRGFRCWA